MVCDVCDRGFHIQCTNLKLDRIPDGMWVCEDCVQCVVVLQSLEKRKQTNGIKAFAVHTAC